jgi:hypothetical protein
VASAHRDAEPAKVARGITGRITAGDDRPSPYEQLGQRAHACAGDSDEVNRPAIGAIEKRHVRRRI